MQKTRKLLAMLLVLALSISMMPAINIQAAKIKLNKTKVTIGDGKTVQLKLKNTKNKVTWKSENKKVATVDKKGLVSGINAGTTTIKATVKVKKKKHTYKCKVTVKGYSNSVETIKDANTTISLKTLTDYDGDSTFIKIANGSASTSIVVDLGASNKAKETVKEILKQLNGKSLDFLIISHWHKDHYGAIAELASQFKSKNIKIQNLVINAIDFRGEKLDPLVKNTTNIVNNVWSFGYYDGDKAYEKTKCGKYFAGTKYYDKKKFSNDYKVFKTESTALNQSGYQMVVLPGMEAGGKDSSTKINNHSMSTVILNANGQPNNKIILPGDLQGEGIAQIFDLKKKNNEEKDPKKKHTYMHYDFFSRGTYKNVIYKASHHGKARWHDFVSTSSALDKPQLQNVLETDAQKLKSEKMLITFMCGFAKANKKKTADTYSVMYENEKRLLKELVKPTKIVGTNWSGFGDKTLLNGYKIGKGEVRRQNFQY